MKGSGTGAKAYSYQTKTCYIILLICYLHFARAFPQVAALVVAVLVERLFFGGVPAAPCASQQRLEASRSSERAAL